MNYYAQNQPIEINPSILNFRMTGEEIKRIRKGLNLSQTKFGELLGVTLSAVQQWEYSTSTISKSAEILLNQILEERNGKSESNAKILNVDSLTYIELPFISIKARASFVEQLENPISVESTIRVLVEQGENAKNNVVIEVDGDSMEPFYVKGMKIRSKMIDPNDWEYINSGVYFVVYRSYFVFKRIKTNDLLEKGTLVLHSDNEQTGGSQTIRKEAIRHIWKALKIVDAPIR